MKSRLKRHYGQKLVALYTERTLLLSALSFFFLASLQIVNIYRNKPLPQCLGSMKEELGAHSRWAA